MLTVRPLEPFASQFFAGAQELTAEAGSIFSLVSALDRMAPGFAEAAELKAAFAVDGVVRSDWAEPIVGNAQVVLFPRVAGGSAGVLPFRRLSPFGVEVLADLSVPLSPLQEQEFRELFAAHSLILARGQRLDMARQRALCGLIGPVLEREGEDGRMSNESGGPSASALSWHADAAYTEHPFDALSLHALDVVPDASATRFVDAMAALDRLDPVMRGQLAAARQDMISPHYAHIAERACDAPEPLAMVRGSMPAIREHPRNRRPCLWVSEMQTARIEGMDWEESRAALRAVFDRFYAADCVLEHRWRNGDFIVWDNIALQHARGDLADAGRRVLQRVIVGTAGAAPHVVAARREQVRGA